MVGVIQVEEMALMRGCLFRIDTDGAVQGREDCAGVDNFGHGDYHF